MERDTATSDTMLAESEVELLRREVSLLRRVVRIANRQMSSLLSFSTLGGDAELRSAVERALTDTG